MALKINDKQRITAEVIELITNAVSAVAIDYHGVTANQMNELRRRAREQDACIRVIKNSLARRAFENTPFSCMGEHLLGPMMFVFSLRDEAAGARLIHEFAEEINAMEVKLISLNGELYDVAMLKKIAELPTSEQALALAMGVMKAPIEKLAKTVKAPVTQLVRVVAAVRDLRDQSKD